MEANFPSPSPSWEALCLPPTSQGLPCCGAVLRRALLPPQGLAAIPASIFYSRSHQKHFDHYIRFCFVKVKDGVSEGRAGLLQTPAACWWCGERGRTHLCPHRMSPHCRPWMRSCKNGRKSSGPDVACSTLPHLVPACSLSGFQPFPGWV